MYSIYHFYKSLYHKKESFINSEKLEKFPFDDQMFSCRCRGIFPDMALRINEDKTSPLERG